MDIYHQAGRYGKGRFLFNSDSYVSIFFANKPIYAETWSRFIYISLTILQNHVDIWVKSVDIFSKISEKEPQAVFVGLTFYLQHEWDYIQRVIAHLE